MNRRAFITLIGGGAVAWPRVARAQQPASNIELLDLVSTPAAADWDAAFTVKRVNLNP